MPADFCDGCGEVGLPPFKDWTSQGGSFYCPACSWRMAFEREVTRNGKLAAENAELRKRVKEHSEEHG